MSAVPRKNILGARASEDAGRELPRTAPQMAEKSSGLWKWGVLVGTLVVLLVVALIIGLMIHLFDGSGEVDADGGNFGSPRRWSDQDVALVNRFIDDRWRTGINVTYRYDAHRDDDDDDGGGWHGRALLQTSTKKGNRIRLQQKQQRQNDDDDAPFIVLPPIDDRVSTPPVPGAIETAGLLLAGLVTGHEISLSIVSPVVDSNGVPHFQAGFQAGIATSYPTTAAGLATPLGILGQVLTFQRDTSANDNGDGSDSSRRLLQSNGSQYGRYPAPAFPVCYDTGLPYYQMTDAIWGRNANTGVCEKIYECERDITTAHLGQIAYGAVGVALNSIPCSNVCPNKMHGNTCITEGNLIVHGQIIADSILLVDRSTGEVLPTPSGASNPVPGKPGKPGRDGRDAEPCKPCSDGKDGSHGRNGTDSQMALCTSANDTCVYPPFRGLVCPAASSPIELFSGVFVCQYIDLSTTFKSATTTCTDGTTRACRPRIFTKIGTTIVTVNLCQSCIPEQTAQDTACSICPKDTVYAANAYFPLGFCTVATTLPLPTQTVVALCPAGSLTESVICSVQSEDPTKKEAVLVCPTCQSAVPKCCPSWTSTNISCQIIQNCVHGSVVAFAEGRFTCVGNITHPGHGLVGYQHRHHEQIFADSSGACAETVCPGIQCPTGAHASVLKSGVCVCIADDPSQDSFLPCENGTNLTSVYCSSEYAGLPSLCGTCAPVATICPAGTVPASTVLLGEMGYGFPGCIFPGTYPFFPPRLACGAGSATSSVACTLLELNPDVNPGDLNRPAPLPYCNGCYASGAPSPSCSDGVQNQCEGGIDCGGPCAEACV